MSELPGAAFTMPTTVFSVLLVLVALYWLTVLFGLLDLEIFDGLFDAAEGLFGGAAEGVEGAVEGLAEGLAEGAAEGLAEGVADGVVEEAGERNGCLGLSGVPMTIIGSAFVVFGWLYSYGGMELLAKTALFAGGGAALVAGVGIGAAALSMGTTAVALRPMRKLFRIAPVTGRRDLVGRICAITTLRVDDTFGQAEVADDEGATILIQARCARQSDLSRGSQALIFEYDSEREVFFVAPLDDDLARLSKSEN